MQKASGALNEWCKPPKGKIELNLNAAIFRELRCIAIAHNHNRRVLGCLVMKITGLVVSRGHTLELFAELGSRDGILELKCLQICKVCEKSQLLNFDLVVRVLKS